MSYLIIGAVAMLGLLWGGCGEKPQPGGGGFSRPPTLVETTIVTPQSVVDRFTAVGSIQAGDTWNWQYWARHAGASSTFSDALTVTFTN